MTINMWVATLAWLTLLFGFVLRRRTNIHVPCMISGISADIALVLYLQVTRSALQTAVQFELPLLQMLHIASSTLALLLYFPVLYLGIKMLGKSPDPKMRIWHCRLAIPCFALRTLGFVLMFSMWRP